MHRLKRARALRRAIDKIREGAVQSLAAAVDKLSLFSDLLGGLMTCSSSLFFKR